MDQKRQFIDSIAQFAVEEYKTSKVLPSLIIAQAILESAWGRSGLARKSKNLFGIKAGKSWKGKKRNYPTREVYDGKEVMIDAFFREYDSFEDSIKDHSKLLQLPRYKKVLEAKNYIEAANEIRKAGYATDPNYTELIIKVIESNNLQKYDKIDNGVEEYMISEKDAQKIIRVIQNAWQQSSNNENRRELARLADEVRKAAGIDPQNK